MCTQTCANASIAGSDGADDADEEGRAAVGLRGARDLEGKTAAAAENGERARFAPLAQASSSRPARGTQIARSPPSRRNATICCTAS